MMCRQNQDLLRYGTVHLRTQTPSLDPKIICSSSWRAIRFAEISTTRQDGFGSFDGWCINEISELSDVADR
jgi:hypothetical protein